MRILRCAAWILLMAPAAMAPPASAIGLDGNRASRTDPYARFSRFVPVSETTPAHDAQVASRLGERWNTDYQGRGPVPESASELRVLALYGPRELATFSGVVVGSRQNGETTTHGESLDRQAEDPWLGFDKVQHLAFSFLWTLGTQYVAVNKGQLSESQALPISIGTSAVIGLSKEYYDLRSGPPNVFSYRDLVANGAGILLATGLILL